MNRILAFLVVLLLFSACQNGKDKNEKSASLIDTLNYTYDSVKVFSKNIPNLTDTTKAIVTFPVFKNDTLNRYIKRQVFNFFAEEEPITSYQDVANSFIKGYDDFVSSDKETKQSWYLKIDIKVLKQVPNYLSLKYIHSDYVGGAHGNSTISFLNYNPKTNTQIELDSLLLKGKMNTLVHLAESIFRKNEKLSATEPLADKYFFDKGKFALAQSFYVSDKGLVFLYNPYEIKAFAEGYTELVIPFSMLKTIAKPHTILTTPL